MNMDMEKAQSFLTQSKQGLFEIEQVLRHEPQDQSSKDMETMLRIVGPLQHTAKALELRNLSDYLGHLSHTLENLRDQEASITKEIAMLLMCIVNLLREVFPAAVWGHSEPIPQYSLEQLTRIAEELKLASRTLA